MQASKIVVGRIYAVKVPNIDLWPYVRVTVTEVQTMTRRRSDSSKMSPHDYTSRVLGKVAHGDLPNGLDPDVNVAPEAVLGEYQEYADLKERELREKAAHEAEQQARQERRNDLLRRFYDAVGLPLPDKLSGHDLPFRADYRHGIEIDHQGVALLLEAAAKKDAQP